MHFTALLLLTVLPYWQDIQTTSVNAETRRTEVVYYATRADALTKGFRESENYRSLNGVWDFKYYEDWHQLPQNNQPAQWDAIQVPGNWEVQGYGTAIYTNIPYDFCPKDPVAGVLPEHFPAALYHRTFTVPEEWQGREVYLNLCGSKSGTYVYVNGREVGYSEDSKDLARFRITPYLRPGENQLVLKIFRYTQASFLECQDFWRISGLERDVYLSSEKTHSGFDFSVVSTLDEDLQTGLFRLRLRSQTPVEVSYELLDAAGTTLADASYKVNGSLETLVDRLPGIKPWTAETPQLYTLLLNVNGEYTRFHVGFRRLEIKSIPDPGRDRQVKAFLVNGQPVKFKGVNLHEHNPYTGHYTTRKNMLEDLLLMKQANINAIRTCHYPQSREFYELCDSLGFYVYDEANIESHGMGYKPERTLGNKPEWYPKHQDRILNMYARTADYPCVTFLSMGNEAGNGVNFYEAYRELKALEKDGMNRPVVYERAESDWDTDLIVPQYPGAEWFRRMGQQYTERPVCPSEYSHAMGNSNGSLDWQWDAIYAHVQLQGAFIWDWVDQGLYDPNRGWTYGGDYGENAPSDANFCCNGIVNPDREPHPAFYEVKHVYQEVSITPADSLGHTFSIFNRHYFKDLSEYTVRYWVERDGKKSFWWKRHKLRFRTAPQSAETFPVKLPRMGKPGEYRIFFEVLGADGSIVACDEALLKNTAAPKAARWKGQLEYSEGDTEIVVRGKDVKMVFDKASGSVKSWQVKGKEKVVPGFGIRPNYWRAPIDNDYGNGAPLRLERFRTPAAPLAAHARKAGQGTVAIQVNGEGVRGAETWTVYPDGTLTVAVRTEPDGQNTEIPRLGLRFRVADDEFRYFGRGPVENYWDRCSGTFKRIWEASAQEQYYPYVRPQECGHHTGTSWLQVGDITVLADEEFEFNALRQSVENLDGGLRKTQTHISDVPENDFTEVCVDYRMTGVGGYDSWGARPEAARTLWSDQSYTYRFTFIPEKEIRYRYE